VDPWSSQAAFRPPFPDESFDLVTCTAGFTMSSIPQVENGGRGVSRATLTG
jgi:hypothetical protein